MNSKNRAEVVGIYSNLKYRQAQLDEFQHVYTTKSDNCEDFFNLGLNIDENGFIVNGAYNGDGCIISTITSEIIIKLIQKKHLDEAKKFLETFIEAVENSQTTTVFNNELDLLLKFKDNKKRIGCLLLTPKNLLTWFKDSLR